MTIISSFEVGQQAPDLTLTDDTGAPISLRALTGTRVVLYFYPTDDTPGCTTQACELRDSWSRFEAVDDLLIYGVSPQDAHSHTKFRAKFDLPFHLLVDDGHLLADAFGFWVEKSLYDKKYWEMERSTVIIAADGTIQAIVRDIQPAKHTAWLAEELGL